MEYEIKLNGVSIGNIVNLVTENSEKEICWKFEQATFDNRISIHAKLIKGRIVQLNYSYESDTLKMNTIIESNSKDQKYLINGRTLHTYKNIFIMEMLFLIPVFKNLDLESIIMYNPVKNIFFQTNIVLQKDRYVMLGPELIYLNISNNRISSMHYTNNNVRINKRR